MSRTLDTVARLIEALSDPLRIRLLNLVSVGEICVCFFVEILDEPQPKISRHLAFLRRHGLVATRRDGKWIHYRLADLPESEQAIVDAVLRAAAGDRRLSRDLARLGTVCCGPPRALADAPRPTLRSGGPIAPD